MRVNTKYTYIDYPHTTSPNTGACKICTAHDLASCEAMRKNKQCKVYPTIV